jgi:3-phenylpropionate/trans-cinnamate dioxygenase ferredoxin reductase subunit
VSEEGAIVIVGAGPAAKAAAGAYREAGGRGPLTILGAEQEAPYERPPLTKGYLRGESTHAELPLEPAEWYADREIELVPGTPVAELNLEAGEARCEDGGRWSFDRCLLATGARPLVPDLPGADGPDVRRIRTVADADSVAGLAGWRVLVIGSGFIGCEAAASLAIRGAAVTVATLEQSPQAERLGEEASARLGAWLAGHGVDVLGEAKLAEIAAAESGTTARFEDGRRQEADGVLLALGVIRNDELAAAAGVEVDDGVLVDAGMVSSNPRLLAAGDVAFAANAAARRALRVEHWGEALNQGEVAGRTLAGEVAAWEVAPGFWSTIGERTIKYAGWGDGWDEVRFEPGRGESFVARYGRDGEIVGVLAHEDDAAYEEGKKLIEERSPWS